MTEHTQVFSPCDVCLVPQSCLALCDPMDSSLPGSSAHGDSPGKNTRVGCHFLLQEIFLTQELNPCLLDSLPAEPLGKQAPLAYLFSTYKLNLFTLDVVGFVEIIF